MKIIKKDMISKINELNTNSEAFKICEILNSHNYECFYVGGCVRDVLMGRSFSDIDIATSASPEEVKRALTDAKIKFTDVGERYGTIVARIAGEEFEITTFRRDAGYSDSRHPESIAFARTIKEDLSRRDFTMNAIALNPFTKELVDPYGGAKDIENKIIKCVGAPEERMFEDSLRILRAIRFAVTLGFDIEENTGNAIRKCALSIRRASKERRTSELRKMLNSKAPIGNVFDTYPEIFMTLFPEASPIVGCSQINKYHHHDVYHHSLQVADTCACAKERVFEVRLSGLLHDIGKPEAKTVGEEGKEHFKGHPEISYRIAKEIVENDLSLTREEKTRVLDLVKNHDINFAFSKKTLTKCVGNYGWDFLKDWRVLSNADFSDHVIPPTITEQKLTAWHAFDDKFEALVKEIKDQETALKVTDLAINGRDLTAAGFVGKEIGDALKKTLDLVQSGELENDRNALLENLGIFDEKSDIEF